MHEDGRHCNGTLQLYSKEQDLHSTYITNCVFNAVLSLTTIMVNTTTIHVLRKSSCSLSKPLRTLFISLAVSDLAVGLVGQPLYIALMANMLTQNYNVEAHGHGCLLFTAFTIVASLLSSVSFLNIMAASVERYLAIHFHLRYEQVVTQYRLAAFLVMVWLGGICPLFFLMLHTNITRLFYGIAGFACVAATSFVYFKIYLVVRRHKNQIQSQAQQAARLQNGEMANVASLRKSAVSTFYVYLVLLVCYTPHFSVMTMIATYGPSATIKASFYHTLTLMFLNSSLNPVIYCWKMRHVRRAMLDTLRNILCKLTITSPAPRKSASGRNCRINVRNMETQTAPHESIAR